MLRLVLSAFCISPSRTRSYDLCRGPLMNKRTRRAFVAFAVILICSQVSIAFCAEIRVLSAVAMKTALDDLAREFERIGDHKITISYATGGELRNRIQGGEFADVTILPRPAFEPLLAQGKVFPDSPIK